MQKCILIYLRSIHNRHHSCSSITYHGYNYFLEINFEMYKKRLHSIEYKRNMITLKNYGFFLLKNLTNCDNLLIMYEVSEQIN